MRDQKRTSSNDRTTKGSDNNIPPSKILKKFIVQIDLLTEFMGMACFNMLSNKKERPTKTVDCCSF
ncbi:hypothetical protein J53TS2_21020 [Paenibacillus sp. J53TS2]|nr:hypothetical protein J53TS2_21020 [Paenibacillus sp. J53TS2]